jgi:uncharacterized membrane protein YhaH (DUF805 family)
MNYNGVRTPVHSYGGGSAYSFYWNQPSWYYHTPFHPAYYYSPPVMYNGAVYPGAFSLTRFIFGLFWLTLFVFAIAYLIRRYNAMRLSGGSSPPTPSV